MGKNVIMKKILLISIAIICFSFQSQKEAKTITLNLSPEEVQLIYVGLGKLPAEQSEQLRAKIAFEFQKQMDTTKKQH